MSGIYLLVLITIWGFVGRAIFLFSKSRIIHENVLRIVIAILLFSFWFGGAFWVVFGKKIFYDAKVNTLCEKDGGIKVLEEVKLPGKAFDKYGNIGVRSESYSKPTDQFYYVIDQVILREADPKILKYTTRIIRRNDDKVLGLQIRYGRGGGDLPGPWVGSTYTCPPIIKSEVSLESAIFKKETIASP